MYVIIGSYFAPLEGKYLLIELVIVRITLNVIVPSNAPKGTLNNSVHRSKNLLSNSQTL
jgi:hypothetical protein